MPPKKLASSSARPAAALRDLPFQGSGGELQYAMVVAIRDVRSPIRGGEQAVRVVDLVEA